MDGEMDEKKWTDDERDEAFDRGMETMQRVALELYRRGREPLLAELETVKRERDEARAEVERLRALDGKHDWIVHDQMHACSKCGVVRRADDSNKPCRGVVRIGVRAEDEIAAAYRRGAEAMREACAKWMSEREGIAQWVYDDALSALPIPGEP